MNGMIVNFEGGEAAGKSTAITAISSWLEASYAIKPVVVREPGGTPIGEQIRTVIHDMRNTNMDIYTELLLYQAARAQIMGEIILPALTENRLILMDRFFDSSLAYQAAGRGIPTGIIDNLNKISTRGMEPKVTIWMDLDPEIGRARKTKGVEVNRMDLQDKEFYEAVRKAYSLFHAHDTSGRWQYIDASKSPDEVLLDVRKVFENRVIPHFVEGSINKERG